MKAINGAEEPEEKKVQNYSKSEKKKWYGPDDIAIINKINYMDQIHSKHDDQ
jgi:hypothetical protein